MGKNLTLVVVAGMGEVRASARHSWLWSLTVPMPQRAFKVVQQRESL